MKSTVFIGAALFLGVAGFNAGVDAVEPAGPATRPAIPQQTGFGSQSTSISEINGAKVVDVHQPGRTIHIEENENGVLLKVTGEIDGNQVTQEYKAKSPEKLKKENPEAYALFKQYNGGAGGIGPEEALKLLEKNLLEQMKASNLPEAQQDQVKNLLKQLRDGAAPGAAPDDARKLLEKDLLEKIKEMNLPEAQQEELKKLLKQSREGAVPPAPGAVPDDVRKLLEKNLLDQIKGANLPDAQQEELKKALKQLQDGKAPPAAGAAPADARKLLEKELQGADLPAAQKEELKKLLKDLPDGK